VIDFIDLFAGAGGLSVGFEKLARPKYRSVWANDFNPFACETYRANFRSPCIDGDIVSYLEKYFSEIPKADLVVGGPPCQGFSLLNKNRELDPRKCLWIPYMQIVGLSGARVFMMENVPQLLGSEEFPEIRKQATAMGFKLWSGILIAADYGVPQVRKRAIIVGSKDKDPSPYFPPPKTHFDPRKRLLTGSRANLEGYVDNARPWTTVRDVLGDLPPPFGTELRHEAPPLDLHFGRSPTAKSMERYRAIPDEGMNRFDLQKRAPQLTPRCWIEKKSGGTDLFGRMWWDRPSLTIRTEFYKPEKGRYLHPSQHRPITHREAARLQTFPDDFRFTGTKIEIARQIGNAVPPLLAATIARALLPLFET
jgi:DNA (cytosine-5)-methyltransferase 1